MKVNFLKKIRYFLEGIFVGMMFVIFHYILPFKVCVSFGGWIAKTVGPRLRVSNRAQANLKKCFPDISQTEIQKIIVEMWNNYGRLLGEYVKSHVFWDGQSLHNIEVVGIENLKRFQEDGKPGIIFTAHLGNWQMIPLAAQSIGFDLTQMYRPPNNPWVDALMLKCQKFTIKNVITKGSGGPKKFLSLIKEKEHVLLLVDQKMGEGISVPFLGHEAMTATGIAKMYLNQNCPIMPARSERLHDSKFRVTFYPPIDFTPQGNQKEDMYNLLLSINNMISEWVTERPGQWLWLHRRWKGA